MEGIIDGSTKKAVNNILKKVTADHEFEISFYQMDDGSKPNYSIEYEKYLRVLRSLRSRNMKTNDHIESESTFDVIIHDKDYKSYRLTTVGLDNINNYMNRFSSYDVTGTIKLLLMMANEKNKTVIGIKKVKSKENTYYSDEYNFKVRLATENVLTPTDTQYILDNITNMRLFYRFKQRFSYFVTRNSNYVLRIDVTSVQQDSDLIRVQSSYPRYELEIDLTCSNKVPNIIEKIMTEVVYLKKILHNSNGVIKMSEKKNVIAAYNKMFVSDASKPPNNVSLYGRDAKTLHISHLNETLPHKYSVTDKADGERHVLITVDNRVYMISSNFEVFYTGIEFSDKKYNGYVIDGEYIYIPKHNRFMYMIFDCMFVNWNDIREIKLHEKRLEKVDDIIQNCFVFSGQVGSTVNKVKTHKTNKHKKEDALLVHFKDINHDVVLHKNVPLIRKKYFSKVQGKSENEIYKNSVLVWDMFTNKETLSCPYMLDGLVFHPLDQKYEVIKTKSVLDDLKWKPFYTNSIDFFVRFEKDAITNTICDVFDNTLESSHPYRICYLHVWNKVGGKNQPVLFLPKERMHIAHLRLDGDCVRDQNGDIIQNETVVEFYYNYDSTLPDAYRWVPIRTRYDKTAATRKKKIKFGNWHEWAVDNMKSILNPITFDDFRILADDEAYREHMNNMMRRGKDGYYEKQNEERPDDFVVPMKQYHNWIKMTMIQLACRLVYDDDEKKNVLDLACGRGGDIAKIITPRTQKDQNHINIYVGIDSDYVNLISAPNSALDRYNKQKRRNKNIPPMYFINADIKKKLNYDEQSKVLPRISAKNRQLMENILNKNMGEFHVINCQFSLHFFLADDSTWSNFCHTINTYLRRYGFVLFTCFDGDRIIELLDENNGVYTSSFDNDAGVTEKLIEITRLYKKLPKNTDTIGTGYAIDVYNSVSNNRPIKEYIVQKDFLIKEMRGKCGCMLVDTGMFREILSMNEYYFNKTAQYARKNIYPRINELVTSDSKVDKISLDFSSLYRYYIFSKVE